jgi:hypothetical protein
MVDWIKLSEETSLSFAAEPDRQLLYGPFLIPDKLIYRHSEKLGEYYVRFKKDQIEKISRKFNSDLNNNNLNFQHSDTKVDATVVENWIVDAEHDKSKKFGFDLPEGSWFGGVFIDDENFWNEEIKTEKVKGFSVEVLAELELALKKINIINMQKQNINLANVMKTDGTPVYYDGTEVVVGTAVFLDEAMTQPAPEGEHELEGGLKIIVTNGLVSEITEIEESVEPTVEAAATTISLDEVSKMIDVRFGELTSEITALKTEIEKMKGDSQKTTEGLNEVKETLSKTPAVGSITDKKEPKAKLAKDFDFALERVRDFAKKS